MRCPRKWIYNHFERKNAFVTSYPMAVGTLFHAIKEWEMTHNGRTPSKTRVKLMEGNYEDPSQAMGAHPDAYDEARSMADVYTLDRFFDTSRLDALAVEAAVDDWNVVVHPESGGVLLGGYIDVLDIERQTIHDWKTRGSFSYAPETYQDFLDNVQLCYYAGLAARQYDWPEATVRHINVLRPSKGGWADKPVEHTIPRWYLDEAVDVVENEVIPDMITTYKTYREHDATHTERNAGACWDYGGCPHRTQCPATQVAGESLVERLSRRAASIQARKKGIK